MRYVWLAALVASISWTAQADERIDYASCARAADPPVCLATLAAPRLKLPHELVEAIVQTGAVDLVPRYRNVWVEVIQRKDRYAPDLFNLLAVPRTIDDVPDYSPDIVAPAATAAIALAAAAQTRDDPFTHATVRKLIAEAKYDPSIPRRALHVSIEANHLDHGSRNRRPRGLAAIWRRVVAEPQFETWRIMSLARSAYLDGYRDEGLALLRIGLQRTDIAPDEIAHAAWWLALHYGLLEEGERLLERARPNASPRNLESAEFHVAQARLLKSYDAASAKLLVQQCVDKNWGCSTFGPFDNETWRALQAAGAKAELMELGRYYLGQARKTNLRDELRGDLFANACESFRRAGDIDAARAAAREGLPFVPIAVAARARTLPPAQTQLEKRRAAIQANGFGAAPVIALYRTGARDEAIAHGFLRGVDRYENAIVAGETPDPLWVVDDGGMFELRILVRKLIDKTNIADADRLHARLRSMKPSELTGAFAGDFGAAAGGLAALLGRTEETRAYFAQHLMLDDPQKSEENRNAIAQFVARYAGSWRQALTTLLRAKSRRT